MRAGNGLATQRRIDMDIAIGDHLGTMIDQGQHDQIGVLGIDLLA